MSPRALSLVLSLLLAGCALFEEPESVYPADGGVLHDAGETTDADASLSDADGDASDADLGSDTSDTGTDAGDDFDAATDAGDDRISRWDPLAYYSFDTIVGGEYRAASQRGVSRGCVIDGSVDEEPDGVRGSAMLLRGGTCWIAHEPAWEVAKGTIVVWVRSDFERTSKAILSKGADEAIGLVLFNAGGYFTAVLRREGVASETVTSGSIMEIGKWYALAISWDPDGTSIWIDGDRVSNSSRTLTFEGNTEFLTIGADSSFSSSGERLPNFSVFDGAIDEMWGFDRVLTTVEMQDLIRQTQ